jgi:DNA anti-recombination protein RmuC
MKTMKYLATLATFCLSILFFVGCDTTPQNNDYAEDDLTADYENEMNEYRNNINAEIEEIDNNISTWEQRREQEVEAWEEETEREYNETIAELRRERDELSNDLNEMENVTAEEWDEFKRGVDQSLQNTESALEEAGRDIERFFDPEGDLE